MTGLSRRGFLSLRSTAGGGFHFPQGCRPKIRSRRAAVHQVNTVLGLHAKDCKRLLGRGTTRPLRDGSATSELCVLLKQTKHSGVDPEKLPKQERIMSDGTADRSSFQPLEWCECCEMGAARSKV